MQWMFLTLEIINLSESILYKLHNNSIRDSSLTYRMLYRESLENCKKYMNLPGAILLLFLISSEFCSVINLSLVFCQLQ